MKHFASVLLLLVASCDSTPIQEPVVLESARFLERLTTEQIAAFDIPVNANFDVDLYSLTYQTADGRGGTTTASGMLAIPDGAGDAPLVSYQHGTEVLKSGVASVGGLDVSEALVAVVFAASGYVAAMPDYLGLGISPGLHPYVHTETLGSATVDMLRASREQAHAVGADLSGQVFLIGYSEGGNATVAAQKHIEELQTDEFDLLASAPMAGAYDLSGVMVDVMQSRESYPAPYYLPYLLLAYDDRYDLFDSWEQALVEPYSTTIPALFDGTHGAGEINNAMPDVPILITQPAFEEAFNQNQQDPLRIALRENDLFDWAPQTPTRLYHCEDDDLIPFENSEVAYQSFTQNGASDVALFPLDFGGHVDCVAPALILGKFWFDSLLPAAKEMASSASFANHIEVASKAGAWVTLPH